MTKRPYRVLAVVGTLLGLVPAAASAQATNVSGRVTSDAGAPLQGVSVSIPTLASGAYTDADGHYAFTVPASRAHGQSAVLIARRIGFQPKSLSVTLSGSPISQDFVLVSSPTELTGIVVTALGIQKEKSELGTAVQQINSAELSAVKAPNVVDQLEGKVSGVQITGSGDPGGSTYMVIRGE